MKKSRLRALLRVVEPSHRPRIVADTNVVISGLIWDSAPARLIEAGLAGQIELLTTIELLAELKTVLFRPKFATPVMARGVDVNDLFDGFATMATRVAPANISPTVLRDPDDDQVLAAALGGSANMIASGDADLLDLGSFRGIPIITAREAVDTLLRG